MFALNPSYCVTAHTHTHAQRKYMLMMVVVVVERESEDSINIPLQCHSATLNMQHLQFIICISSFEQNFAQFTM